MPVIRLVVDLWWVVPRGFSSLYESLESRCCTSKCVVNYERSQGAVLEGAGPYCCVRPEVGVCGARVECMYNCVRPVAAPELPEWQ